MKPLKERGFVKFFTNTAVGKTIVSVGYGVVSPFLGPFGPSVKSLAGGLAGKDKHDKVGYMAAGLSIILIAVHLLGYGEQLQMMLGILEQAKDLVPAEVLAQ